MSLSKTAAIATIIGCVVAVIAFIQSWDYLPQKENIKITSEPKIAVNQNIPIRACTDKDYYQIGWNRSEPIDGISGWRGGGSNPTNWCNQLINNSIQGRSIDSNHEVKVINSSEEGRWTGTFGRTRQYNYYCKILLNWDPKFEKKENVICQ